MAIARMPIGLFIEGVRARVAVERSTAIPYHASGELCEYYSAEDMTLIVSQTTQFKTYHTSYFNSLKNWVESMGSIAEVGEVFYGDPVPAEFCSVVLTQLMQTQEAS